jgi:heme/copper-type cytochrome/quinol oxidase subunit 1
MIIPKGLSRPEFRFFALAICLLPLGIFTFHSDWPPSGWMHIHFAEGDIGKTILACSGLFFVFALAYFFFPRIFRRRMNRVLGQIHFWLNVLAFLVRLALPIYFNLIFHSPPDETKVGTAFRAFGAEMDAILYGIEVLAIVQILFLVNALWSAFRGERSFGMTTHELFSASKKASA